MIDKFKEIENRIFSAPYKWFIKKGIVIAIETSKQIYMNMNDLYESRYDEPYNGNPNWAGDD